MLRDEVLSLLKQGDEPRSGEEMSRALGVSRAAVWKAIEALRQEGYGISSAPRRGYVLESSPDRLSPGELSGALAGRLLGRELLCLERVDSTNDEVKRRAAAGAAEGLAVLAEEQTGGKGRRGRSFLSPAGKGLYLSVLLRPRCSLRELMWLTSWTAVAVCGGIQAACGVRPGIKWTNDLVLEGRKLCGILTELGLESESNDLDYLITGIGINVNHTPEDFDSEVRPIATSLAQELGHPVRRAQLAVEIIRALDRMYAQFPQNKQDYLERYRADCLTVGKQVQLITPAAREEAFAVAIDDDFRLVVEYPDGRRAALSAGEVSVRGMYGYV